METPAPPLRPVRVLIVDDDPMLCQGLSFLLEQKSRGEITIVGIAHDGAAAITAVQAHHPDVVLMDIDMPRMDGIESTRAIRALPNPPEVVIITTFDANDEVVRASEAGAGGFVLKTEDPDLLIDAIRAATAGEGVLSPKIGRQLMEYLRSAPENDKRRAAHEAFGTLTEREKEVAELVAEGMSNTEIAQTLYLSESTVKTHLAAAQDKLGAPNRVVVAVQVTLARV